MNCIMNVLTYTKMELGQECKQIIPDFSDWNRTTVKSGSYKHWKGPKRHRKDTKKSRKDTKKDHNDTEKNTCTYLIPERRLYRFVSE